MATVDAGATSFRAIVQSSIDLVDNGRERAHPELQVSELSIFLLREVQPPVVVLTIKAPKENPASCRLCPAHTNSAGPMRSRAASDTDQSYCIHSAL